MRPIIFRGLRVDGGGWVEGFFWKNSTKSFIKEWDKVLKKWYDIEVIPETVGEYSGRTDKNEKMIFEGDCFNSLYRKDGCEGIYVIEFNDGCFYPKKVGKHQQPYVTITLWDLDRCDRIGNIHENPELLEGN